MANYHIKPIAWKTGTQTPGSPNLENGDGVLYFTLLLWEIAYNITNNRFYRLVHFSQTNIKGVKFLKTSWIHMSKCHPLCLSQQDDLTALGRIILALSCNNLLSVRGDMQSAIDVVQRNYSPDLKNLIQWVNYWCTKRTISFSFFILLL